MTILLQLDFLEYDFERQKWRLESSFDPCKQMESKLHIRMALRFCNSRLQSPTLAMLHKLSANPILVLTFTSPARCEVDIGGKSK